MADGLDEAIRRARRRPLEQALQRAQARMPEEADPAEVRHRGPWSPVTRYRPGNVVEHEGSSYMAVATSVGSTPPSPPWELLARRGERGPSGSAVAGPQGPIGPAGSGSNINAADEGGLLPGGPFELLNFAGAGVTATDAGGGQADITVPFPAHSDTLGQTADDHHTEDHAARHQVGGADAVAVTHAQTTGQGTDDHHDESHAHDGADGSGTVAHADTTGKTANDHHDQAHAIDGGDHTGALAHSATSGQGTDDHHAQDHAARHEPGGADTLTFLRSDITPDSAPGRALDVSFQPSATRPVLVIYSVKINRAALASAEQDASVRLLSDAADPPTTVRAEIARDYQSQALTGNIRMGITGTLPYLVPAGHHVLLEIAL